MSHVLIYSFIKQMLIEFHYMPDPLLGAGDVGKQNRPHTYFNKSSILV